MDAQLGNITTDDVVNALNDERFAKELFEARGVTQEQLLGMAESISKELAGSISRVNMV